MSERFKELVLKTSDSQEPWVRIPPSPPQKTSFSVLNLIATYFKLPMEMYSSGDEAPLLRA